MKLGANKVLQDLLQLLDLEPLEVNLFRGESRDLGGKSVFGGQVLGQALVAGSRTVEGGQPVHSLHAYFLRPGDMEAPIVYEVDRIRDGSSFVTRRVQGIQHGKVIFSMIASFHRNESGFEHLRPMPDVPPPEDLPSQRELRERWLETHTVSPRLARAVNRPLAIEFKPVEPYNLMAPDKRAPQQDIWIRAAGELPDDPILHRCVLGYASDFNLLTTALLPHGKSFLDSDMMVASLDHALWFHQDVKADEWLLYSMDSPVAGGGRGHSRGLIYNRAGEVVASVVQESLMRHSPSERDD